MSEPTRVTDTSSTLIDLVFVSSVHDVKSCTTIPSLENADHYGLWIAFSTTSCKCIMEPITRKVWHYAHADWEKAEELLDCIEWDSLLSTDVNECCSTWKTAFYR